MRTSLLYASILFVLAGCAKKEESDTTNIKTFPLRGQVIRIMPEAHRIMIAHREIPNYMKAMTMAFKVKDTMLLSVAQPGDSVVATLAVSRVESWLETISVLGKGE
jgi:Cu/Ag efflux protein CusF